MDRPGGTGSCGSTASVLGRWNQTLTGRDCSCRGRTSLAVAPGPNDRAGPLDDLPARGAGQVFVAHPSCAPGHCRMTYRSGTIDWNASDRRSLSKLRRQHQLHDRSDQQQRCHDSTPSPSRESIAVIHPQRTMQPTQPTQQCDGRDEWSDETDRRWGMAEQQHPNERPRGRIDSRKHAPAGPVRRVRRGFSGNEQPHGCSIPKWRAVSARPRSHHTGGFRSGCGSHRRPASRADAHATSASFFIVSIPPSVKPGPASSRATMICDFGTWFR